MDNLSLFFENGKEGYDEFGEEVIFISHSAYQAAKKEFEFIKNPTQCEDCEGRGLIPTGDIEDCTACKGTGNNAL